MFLGTLPALLKYHPRWFWKVILHREVEHCPILAAQLAAHFEGVFWDDTAPSAPCPLPDASSFVPFTPDELTWVLMHKFNAGASSGLCPVPS